MHMRFIKKVSPNLYIGPRCMLALITKFNIFYFIPTLICFLPLMLYYASHKNITQISANKMKRTHWIKKLTVFILIFAFTLNSHPFHTFQDFFVHISEKLRKIEQSEHLKLLKNLLKKFLWRRQDQLESKTLSINFFRHIKIRTIQISKKYNESGIEISLITRRSQSKGIDDRTDRMQSTDWNSIVERNPISIERLNSR